MEQESTRFIQVDTCFYWTFRGYGSGEGAHASCSGGGQALSRGRAANPMATPLRRSYGPPPPSRRFQESSGVQTVRPGQLRPLATPLPIPLPVPRPPPAPEKTEVYFHHAAAARPALPPPRLPPAPAPFQRAVAAAPGPTPPSAAARVAKVSPLLFFVGGLLVAGLAFAAWPPSEGGPTTVTTQVSRPTSAAATHGGTVSRPFASPTSIPTVDVNALPVDARTLAPSGAPPASPGRWSRGYRR